MLKGISHIIPPELLKILDEMGHGDEIVLGDSNFPAATMGKRLVRCDGSKMPELLDAILKLFPLDSYGAEPVTLMQVVPGDPIGTPPIWNTYREIIKKHEPDAKIVEEERFSYYDHAKRAFAVVQTGEGALYANIILRKGVVIEKD